MRLENADTYSDLPLPVAHVVLRCQLSQTTFRILGSSAGSTSADEIVAIQQQTEQWFASFSST
ncbi:hypothetical protein ASPZODRAFT_128875 [Penicilliopsis zonata CBS 506.65]|uniref:Uncharacterized protein n=1 Tax=Penicilliopsis zonata CBS 506.65 TaxID=1073090 RepID=A0A1L9ST20_9EURO|nr:hypothetical protein ASPZODRAFT_128875 [Penicilliopsis zonata CBS 506.65]OJJ50247.1 hypothetical protein ASPZODRAFT_128875 [Penicilliopsis zonata CBS 506.65]